MAASRQSGKTWVDWVQKTSWLARNCTKPARRGVQTCDLSSLEHPLTTPPNEACNINMPKTEQEGSWLKSHKHHRSTESMVSGGHPKRELVPPGRQQRVVRVLWHDEWSLTPGRLLLGALSLGDTKDSSNGRFHHGGALVIWSLRRPWMSFGFFQLFWIPT